MAQAAIESLLGVLHNELGEDLVALYLYGSLRDGTYQADQLI
jgi:hypothetical protein